MKIETWNIKVGDIIQIYSSRILPFNVKIIKGPYDYFTSLMIDWQTKDRFGNAFYFDQKNFWYCLYFRDKDQQ